MTQADKKMRKIGDVVYYEQCCSYATIKNIRKSHFFRLGVATVYDIQIHKLLNGAISIGLLDFSLSEIQTELDFSDE